MALLDQRRHRCTAPQRKRQAKRVRQMATDQIPHFSLLALIQQSARTRVGATAAALQPGLAAGGKALADVEDPRRRQSNLRCDGTIGQPRLTQSDNLPPTLFLRRRS
jgi:hypothetical protein